MTRKKKKPKRMKMNIKKFQSKVMAVLPKLAWIAILLLLVSLAYAETEKTRYSDLEKENISDESGNILKEYYGSILGTVGSKSKFNTISAKDNIAIINLTIDGKDRRILTRLSNGIAFGTSNLALGTVNNLTVIGNLAINGLSYYNINDAFGIRIYGTASTLPRVTDEGTSRLFNGTANVSINPVLRSAIDNYKVYLSPQGRTQGIWVAEKTKDYFIVKGVNAKSNVKFSWMLSGLRNYNLIDTDKKYEIKVIVDYENGLSEINLSGNYSQPKNNPIIITGNVVDIGNLNETVSANSYVLNITDESAVIDDVVLRFELSQDDVKRHIKFEYKESQNSSDEDSISNTPQSYVEREGSVIIKLGTENVKEK